MYNYLFTWSEKWKMHLNFDKCVVLRLSLKRLPIESVYNIDTHNLETVSSYSDLGVTIDTKLTFSTHVVSIVTDARRLLGMLKRTGNRLSVDALLMVYKTFVRTKLEYASVVWNSIDKVFSDKLEAVQLNFVKFLCYLVISLKSDLIIIHMMICL